MSSLLAFVFPTGATIIGWILFGSIGTVAVGYARLKADWLYAAIGIGLMLYPYFLPSGLGLWITGVALTVMLFLPRRYFPGE